MNHELELELELLQLESSMLLEDKKDENNGKLKAFFTKIFKWIKDTIDVLKNKILLRFSNIEKAYKKHYVSGNPEIEFKGAGSMDMVTDVGASLGESISFIDDVNSEKDLEGINTTLDKYDNTVKSYDLNKVSKTTVDKLGDVIKQHSRMKKDIKGAERANNVVSRGASMLLRLTKPDSDEAKELSLLKKKTVLLKRALGIYQDIVVKASNILVRGIVAMKKVKVNSESFNLNNSLYIEAEIDTLIKSL